MLLPLLWFLAGCSRSANHDCDSHYTGRFWLDPAFEDARADAEAYLPQALSRAEAKLGPLAPDWRVMLAYRDEQQDLPAAETSKLGRCKTILIEQSTSDLAFGPSRAGRLVLDHEAAHAVFMSNVPDAALRTDPPWLSEGVAVWAAEQETKYAKMLLGNFVRKPDLIPDVQSWTLRSEYDGWDAVDYLVSGGVVSEALAAPDAPQRFLAEHYAGRDGVDALLEASNSSLDDLVRRARARARRLIDQVADAHGYEEVSLAIQQKDEGMLRAYLYAYPDSFFASAAAYDLQYFVCRRRTLDECLSATEMIQRYADDLATTRQASTELSVASALERAGDFRGCARRAWDALRRASGVLPEDELTAGFLQIATCAAAAGDRAGVSHVGRVAAESVGSQSARASLLQRMAKTATRHGMEQEADQLTHMALPVGDDERQPGRAALH